MPSYLILGIIRYVSRVSRAIQRKELHPPLHLGVVVFEKGAFGSPSTTVAQFIFIKNLKSENVAAVPCMN